MIRLNIGSGPKRYEGYTNIDQEPSVNPDLLCDLAHKFWPVSDNDVEHAVCSHVMEHIGDGYKHFMQEMYRVMAPGAEILCAVPHPRHDIFLGDPTHVRPITPRMLSLFSRDHIRKSAEVGDHLTSFADLWGIDFELFDVEHRISPDLNADLKADVVANPGYFERCVPNTFFETAFKLRAIK